MAALILLVLVTLDHACFILFGFPSLYIRAAGCMFS